MGNEAVNQRIHHVMDRTEEYFSEPELRMRMGHGAAHWPFVLLKELIDNALDACEREDDPSIVIEVGADYFSVRDNGPGIPADLVTSSLDYLTRTSDSLLYVSPSRGQLGNALKTLWAAGLVANAESWIEVMAADTHHDIRVSRNDIGNLEVGHEMAETVNSGTFVKAHWADAASCLAGTEMFKFYQDPVCALIEQFSASNPHVAFAYAEYRWEARGQVNRWHKDKPTSAHWYSVEDMRRLIAGTLTARPDMTTKQFVGQFNGLASTAKRKLVGDQYPGMMDAHQDCRNFLRALCNESKPVKASALGVLGRESMFAALLSCGGATALDQYKRISGDTAVPWNIEIATGVMVDDQGGGRRVMFSVNNTPLLKSPGWLVDTVMTNCDVTDVMPVVVFINFTCPKVLYEEAGKGALCFTEDQEEAVINGMNAATKQWQKLVKSKTREQRVARSEIERAEKMAKVRPLTMKEACHEVLEEAYAWASDDGRLPVNARQMMYRCRDQAFAKGLVTTWFKHAANFTQGVLPDFVEANPELTATWDVHYDARGELIESHTGTHVQMGTKGVRTYDMPDHNYGAVLFIEKEGFNALIEASEIRERYDIATVSSKGMPTTAVRELVDMLTAKNIPLFVLRDFDPAGFTIAKTLTESNRRHQFDTTPLVTDIGLRLVDAEEMGLTGEPFNYSHKQNVDPADKLEECGATPDEIDFLVSGNPGAWTGERIELNAMSSKQFIDYTERKLEEHGVEKVIPDEDTLAEFYEKDALKRAKDAFIAEALKNYTAPEIDIPDVLTSRVRGAIEGTVMAWRAALSEI